MTSENTAVPLSPAPAAPVAPRAQHALYSPSFHGEGSQLFGLMFIGAFLSAITLGIYSFWFRVKLRNYFHQNTEFAGDRFAYSGTAVELIIGTVKAMVVLAVAVGVYLGLGYAIHPAVATIFLLVVFALLTPVVTIGAMRYRLARTSWRGIRFSFRGRVSDYVKVFLPGWFFTLITGGLYGPWFYMRTREYRLNHTYFGNKPLHFDGRGLEGEMLFKGIIASLLWPFTLGLSLVWNMAWIQREVWRRTSFQSAGFQSTVTGGALFKHYLVNGLLLVVTLGLAFPWVRVRNQRFFCEHLSLEGVLDFDAIIQDAQSAPATLDELGEMLDLGVLDLDLGL